MTRQYKTMQTQLESRIQFLESQVRKLQSELSKYLSLCKIMIMHIQTYTED